MSEILRTFHSALVGALVPTRQSFEICYVDDGSRDGTRAQLIALSASDHRVRFTSLSRRFGAEAATLAGLRMARGDAVILMEAGSRHPPELVPRMLELRRLGYDQVVARRDRTGEGLRAFLGRACHRAMERFMEIGPVDGAGDFRLLSRRAVDGVLSLPEHDRYSRGIFSWIGFDTVSLSYRQPGRTAAGGRAGRSVGELVGRGIDGVVSFNSRPLRLAVHAGLGLVLAALAYTVWVVVHAVRHGVGVPGYTTLLTAVVALGGMQWVTLGIIGEYVGRIHHEAKHRPHYVVRETDTARAVRPPAGPPRPAAPRDPAGEAEPSGTAGAGRAGRRTVRQFAVFAAIGCVNTAVYLAVYAVMNRWMPYLTAHLVGYSISVVVSFLLNSLVTLRTRPTWRAFARYPVSSVAGLLGAGVLLYLAVGVLGMDKNIAALAAGVLVTPLSFLLARWAITSGAVAPAGRQ
ncbi:glycosyltransferase [Streptomyces sp. NPDC014894]|uniref:glycosyltransferase n=1 Tax=Streptomyces sp. NPDC014894 TaxID=3364931 RepID=UPI003701397A